MTGETDNQNLEVMRNSDTEATTDPLLQDVFVEQIADLQSAEQQLISALPKMAEAASDDELRKAFLAHLDETRGHADRLRKIASIVGTTVPSEECQAMKGLVAEGEDTINRPGTAVAKDAALIAAAQRVEHYEIAAYGTAKTLAKEIGLDDAVELLDETLDEESEADKLLTKIATGGLFSSGVNEKAATS